jgi:hypothetical protein
MLASVQTMVVMIRFIATSAFLTFLWVCHDRAFVRIAKDIAGGRRDLDRLSCLLPHLQPLSTI